MFLYLHGQLRLNTDRKHHLRPCYGKCTYVCWLYSLVGRCMGLKDHLSLPLFQLHHLQYRLPNSNHLRLSMPVRFASSTTAAPVHTHQPLRARHPRVRPFLHSEHSANETRMIQQLARVSNPSPSFIYGQTQ